MKIIMKKQNWKPLSFISIAVILGTMTASCGGGDELPCCDAEVTDPYCVDTPDWYENVEIGAAFDETDPSLLVVSFEPTNDIVDMSGYVDVDGAEVQEIVFPDHELWLILATDPDYDTIAIQGVVNCTTESQGYLLTLHISPDGSVSSELSFTSDADAGDADAGNTDTEK
jgi:hypothetical protein